MINIYSGIKIMFRPLYRILHSVFLSIFLFGCSEDLSKMSIEEQSLHQPDRFSDDKSRDKSRKPLDILKFSGIEPGMQIIDLFGGGGYYTELFSYIAGEKGKVYLQNNTLFLRFSKDEIENRLKNNRIKNVIRLDSEFSNMQLPKNVDLIFIGLSYHDIYIKRKEALITTTREEFFPQVYSALKPGGRLLIVDHAAKKGSGITTTAKLHRIDEEWAIKDIESAGFKLIKTLDVLKNPKDDHTLDIWKKKFFHKTDRFIHLYIKQ